MSHSYRKDRYITGESSAKEGYSRVIFTVFVIITCMGVIAYQWMNTVKLKDSIAENKVIVSQIGAELDVLRTLNPYHVESSEILATAVENVDLFPGWIARVYPVPQDHKKANFMNDLGSFVMNETRFSLSSHKRYGIPQPSKSMYRLNGLFPSYKSGRLQVGVEFYLTNNSKSQSKDSVSKICSCYARIDINNKRVIDKKLHMVTRYDNEMVLTGEVELPKGVFPISALLYCDEKSDFTGDDVQVSISFRNPSQHSLSSNRYSIFHIYKPENFTAKL
jgi:hypothetical protein